MGTQTYSSRFRVEPTAPSRGPGRITLHYDVYVPRADGRGSDVNTLANTMTERQARDLAQELLQAADAIAAEREIARLELMITKDREACLEGAAPRARRP